MLARGGSAGCRTGGSPVAGMASRARTMRQRCRTARVVASAAAEAPALSEVKPEASVPPVKVPRSIHEVDNGQILGFGADLSEDHPGFHDQEYKTRRTMIANIAKAHQIGDPIPRVQYNAAEVEVWRTVLHELEALFPTHACKEYLESYLLFNFRPNEIPQLQDISDVLKRTTGWQVRPVAGLMHPRDFLNGLAFKYFHSTQYVRHQSKPMYTPEPDVCHELIGHVPMLADPQFADMVQAIGEASLGADDKAIWHLTKVYWYTVEFGVVREHQQQQQQNGQQQQQQQQYHKHGDIKAFGAGILSSFGELEWMLDGDAALEPFNPWEKLPKMSYKDGFQKRYFVLDSFEAGAQLLRDYAASVRRVPEQLRGDLSTA